MPMQEDFASTGKRVKGGLIDIVAAFFFLMLFCTIFGGVNAASDARGSFSFDIFSLPFIAGCVAVCFVFAWCEAKYGKTPGKHFMKTKVISYLSVELTFGQAFIRNLMRTVDYFMLIGLLCIIATGHKQRLGDMAAKTIVIMDAGNQA
jgi:uncharacterized RDD family membrane protein YckC